MMNTQEYCPPQILLPVLIYFMLVNLHKPLVLNTFWPLPMKMEKLLFRTPTWLGSQDLFMVTKPMKMRFLTFAGLLRHGES